MTHQSTDPALRAPRQERVVNLTLPTTPTKLHTVLRGWLDLNAEVCCVVREYLECHATDAGERRQQCGPRELDRRGDTVTQPSVPHRPDELALYRIMYLFLSGLRECRCRWSMEQILERLVEDMLRSWVCVLCDASQCRLACPSCAAAKAAGGLNEEAEQMPFASHPTRTTQRDASATDSKAAATCTALHETVTLASQTLSPTCGASAPNHITCVQNAYRAQDVVWCEVRAEARSQWRALLLPSSTHPVTPTERKTGDDRDALTPHRRSRDALQTVGALSHHYRLMKHVLRFVLLRVDEMRGTAGLLPRVLHRVMRELLQQNSALLLDALAYSAEVIISVAPETGGGSWVNEEGQLPLDLDQPFRASCGGICSARGLLPIDTACPDSVRGGLSGGAMSSTMQRSADVVNYDEVGAAHMLLEDCGLIALQERNDAVVQQQCAQLGRCVVRAVLQDLCTVAEASSVTGEGGRCCAGLCLDEGRRDWVCETAVQATAAGGVAAAAGDATVIDHHAAACETTDKDSLAVEKVDQPTWVALQSVRVSEVEANKGLREVMQHYVRLRSSLLRYYAGAAQLMDKVSVAIQGRIVHALHAFFDGLAEGDILGRFVTRWSVPLWLQLCEETLRRQAQARQGLFSDGGLSIAPPRVTERALRHPSRQPHLRGPAKTAGLNADVTAAVDVASSSSAAASRSFRDARSEPARSQRQGRAQRRGLVDAAVAGTDAREAHALRARLQVHYMAHLPPEGFPTLLYLLPAAEAERGALLARFSDGVHAYLADTLRRELTRRTSAPADRSSAAAALRMLPTAVFERCIFALKMTYAAFGSEIERVTRMRVDSELDEEDEEREEESGHTADGSGAAMRMGSAVGQAGEGEMEECDGLYVFHTPWDRHKDKADLLQRRRRCYLTATEEALVAVRRGLQSFFAEYESLVIPTIAGALHAQTLLAPPPRLHGAAVLDVVDTLLDLATLLPSKDIFVTYYERLLASHLLTVTGQSPRRKPADASNIHVGNGAQKEDGDDEDADGLALLGEVLHRMARRLGRTVTSRCLSLLRDVARALREEQKDYFALLLAPRGGCRRRAGGKGRTRRPTSDEDDAASLPDVPPHQPTSLPSSSMSYPAVLLQRAANLLRPAGGGATARSTTAASETTSSALGRAASTVTATGTMTTTTTGAWSWWQSPRLEAVRVSHVVAPHTRRPLLTGVRVLCQAWWEPYSAVLVSSTALRTMCVEQGWWQDRLIDAVLRVEWCYGGGDLADFDGFGTCRTPSPLRRRHSAHRSHRTTAQPQRRAESDLRASLVALSQSTSLVVQSVSSALSSAMQQSGNRLYDNLRATEHHSGSLGNAAFDVISEQDEAYSDLPAAAAVTMSSLTNPESSTVAERPANDTLRAETTNAPPVTPPMSSTSVALPRTRSEADGAQPSSPPTTAVSTPRETTATTTSTALQKPATLRTDAAVQHERRRLVWPLCSGELTFVVHPRRLSGHTTAGFTRRDSVQVTGPPLTLVLLQLLNRYTRYASDEAAARVAMSEGGTAGLNSPCTMTFIQTHLPVRVPLRVLTTLVMTLLRMGVVQRVKDETTGQVSYGLPCAFGHLAQHKVLVRPRRPPHTWQELSAVSDHTVLTFDPTGMTDIGDERTSTAIAAEAADLQRMFFTARTRKVQVCIVREMKTKLSLSHAELFNHVANALQEQFILTVALFKQAVTQLVERGFLERCGDEDGYQYIS